MSEFKKFEVDYRGKLGWQIVFDDCEWLTENGETTTQQENAGSWKQDHMARDVLALYNYPRIAEFRENVKGWACKGCRRFWGNNDRSEYMSRYCCTNLNVCDCGEFSKRNWSSCDSCRAKHDAERTKKRLDSATRMTIEEAESLECLFIDDDHYGNDGVQELIEQIHWNIELKDICPVYVWATKPEAVHLDIENALENTCEPHFEDAYDHLNGIKELQQAVDNFNESNKNVKSFYPDYSRVLVVESLEQIGVKTDA